MKSTPDDPGSGRSPARVHGGVDRYQALLEVLEQQADRAADDDAAQAHPFGRRVAVVLLVLLLAATVWLWVFPPAWLAIEPPPPSPAEQEASLRFAMYVQAQRIRAYQLETGELPTTLEEAGAPLPGMGYRLVEPGVYELTGATDRLRLTYRSDQPLRQWVGSGAEVLERALP